MTGTRIKKEIRYVCKTCGYCYFNRLPLTCDMCEGTAFRVDLRGLGTAGHQHMGHQLTAEEEAYRAQISEKRRVFDEARKEYTILIGKCQHVIVPRDQNIREKLKTDMWASTGAVCAICGTDFGWWCPKSPDGKCHYSKSFDDCDYCHMPDERK